jgi:penicillin-binding protein 1A
MMRDVVREGTARAASKLPFAIAGKTGTTDDFRDAWFVGFSPQLLCLVWIGYDNNMPLGPGESGAVAALPIWIEFMSKALPMYPNEDFHF